MINSDKKHLDNEINKGNPDSISELERKRIKEAIERTDTEKFFFLHA